MKKTLKRIAVGVAALSVLCAVPFMAGCDSSHPEAQITISYDGTEYVLNYKLYRNMYPRRFSTLSSLPMRDFTTIP